MEYTIMSVQYRYRNYNQWNSSINNLIWLDLNTKYVFAVVDLFFIFITTMQQAFITTLLIFNYIFDVDHQYLHRTTGTLPLSNVTLKKYIKSNWLYNLSGSCQTRVYSANAVSLWSLINLTYYIALFKTCFTLNNENSRIISTNPQLSPVVIKLKN